MSNIVAIGPYVLGIDLGSHSLGWAVLPLDEHGNPFRIERLGVRTFEAGVIASYDQMLEGKQKSKAADRRAKRGPRRQFRRRAWRRYKVLKCLVAHGLLRDPEGPNPDDYDLRDPVDQDRFLKAVDALLRKRLRPAKDDPRRHLWEQVWPYELRASALERKLDPLELGRAFYHLAQRRGFLSNRKTDTAEEDKPKKKRKSTKAEEPAPPADEPAAEKKEDTASVKEAITALGQDMERAIPDPRFRTLGYYFARHVNPEEHRIRARWIGRREHYEPEFKAICDAQAAYYPALAEGQPFREELHEAIFYQRPLKPCGHLVGHCDLEPGRKRALQALPIAQRFRLLQKVNDLRVLPPDGSPERFLEPSEREKLLESLSTKDHLTFKQIRKLFGFTESKLNKETKAVEAAGHTFNLERGGEDRILGDRTTAKILACEERASGVTQRWNDMSESMRERLVLALVEFEDSDALAEHLHTRFGFDARQADALSKVRVEESRCSLSRRAITRLLPHMEDGIPFATAKEQIPKYQAKAVRSTVVLDFLPRVLATDEKHVPRRHDNPAFMRARDLRNPAVTRSLAELRKVVNAIIRRYGKPERIHVELGRELKKSPLQAEITSKNNELRRDARRKAAEKMCKEANIQKPSDEDITKWVLAEECNWKCPYTGKTICPRTLFDSPQFEIEHIIPRSISLDDSFDNLTLCDVEYNRSVKKKQTPFQAAGHMDSWDAMLERVKRFRHQKRAVKNPKRMAKNRVIYEDRPNRKPERFAWTPEQVQEFYGDRHTPRQLTDTQYASKLAMKYLGMLYGGTVERAGFKDETGELRVQATSGGVTSDLRWEWGLNGIIPELPDSPARKLPHEIRLDEKLRTDHRHHAVDAVVIACTGPRQVALLANAPLRVKVAQLRREDVRDSKGRRRWRYAKMNPPWGTEESFVNEVRSEVEKINVSHRLERKLQGELHEGTDYSKPFRADDGKETYRTRRLLRDLKPNEVESIIDDKVRKAVKEHLNGGDPKKVFKTTDNHPVIGKTREGKPVFVKSVRIKVTAKPVTIYDRAGGTRRVKPGSNHHMTIIATLNPDGTDKRWDAGTLASRLDAARLKRDHDRAQRKLGKKRDGKQVVIDSAAPAGKRFVFAIQPGDMLLMERPNQPERLYVVRTISKSGTEGRKPTFRIEYVTAIDARKQGDIKPPKREEGAARRTRADIDAGGPNQWFNMTTMDELRQYEARKVVVTPLGELVFESKLNNAVASQ